METLPTQTPEQQLHTPITSEILGQGVLPGMEAPTHQTTQLIGPDGHILDVTTPVHPAAAPTRETLENTTPVATVDENQPLLFPAETLTPVVDIHRHAKVKRTGKIIAAAAATIVAVKSGMPAEAMHDTTHQVIAQSAAGGLGMFGKARKARIADPNSPEAINLLAIDRAQHDMVGPKRESFGNFYSSYKQRPGVKQRIADELAARFPDPLHPPTVQDQIDLMETVIKPMAWPEYDANQQLILQIKKANKATQNAISDWLEKAASVQGDSILHHIRAYRANIKSLKIATNNSHARQFRDLYGDTVTSEAAYQADLAKRTRPTHRNGLTRAYEVQQHANHKNAEIYNKLGDSSHLHGGNKLARTSKAVVKLISTPITKPVHVIRELHRASKPMTRPLVGSVTKPARAVRERINDFRADNLANKATLNRIEASLHDKGKAADGTDLPAGVNSAELRNQKLEKARIITDKLIQKRAKALLRRAKYSR